MQAGWADSRNRVRDSRNYAEDKPGDCKHCYFWKGKRKGCSQKDAAKRNAITFFQKEKQYHQMFRKILCHRNLAKMILAPVKAVHTADIPHVSAIAYRRFCMK